MTNTTYTTEANMTNQTTAQRTRNDKWAPRLIDWNALTFAGIAFWCDSEDEDGAMFLDFDWELSRGMDSFDWVAGADPTGDVSKCTVCGHNLRKFVALVDLVTNEGIVVGYDCAETHSDFLTYASASVARAERKMAQQRERKAAQKRIAEFVADKPELAAAFELDHSIIGDIKGRLGKWGSISDKQVAFVLKLAAEVAEKAAQAAQAQEDKPAGTVVEGRYLIVGEVLATKWVENDFGGSEKMLVEVQQADGYVRLWGTVPSAIDVDRGDKVSFNGTVEAGSDADFGFFKRPAKATVVEA